MLQLKDITKDYITGEKVVNALRGIDVNFSKCEFVSILGPSGCGKTTLLNIIGGLDSYTSGDLIIDGVSTKSFKNRHWDNYRNHQIGFVFQSYNLINHQNVITNVELALILSGASKEERRKKAYDALEKVVLSDVANKLPNQLSGGQMQRVAIARAIVNNPKIILADEPTGALDSETSIQVMEILKELSSDRLVIMVTHNPELAKKYSTRIIRLKDGKITHDSNEYIPTDEELNHLKLIHEEKVKEFKDLKKRRLIFLSERKLKMSFKTAFTLSIKNLFTKKTRTILTATAGSIGIIGIALISSISTGVNSYIDKMQQDTLSQYPLQIETNAIDYTQFINILMNKNVSTTTTNEDKIIINDSLNQLLTNYSSSGFSNDLKSFKTFLESDNVEAKKLKENVNSIEYLYQHNLNIYYDHQGEITKVSPDNLYNKIVDTINGGTIDKTILKTLGDQFKTFSTMLPGSQKELYNQSLVHRQYDLVAKEFGSRWPSKENECLLVLDENNTISDYAYYSIGLGNQKDIYRILNGEEVYRPNSLDYQQILNMNYKIILPTDSYIKYDEVNVYGHSMNLYRDRLNEKNQVDEDVLKELYDQSEISMKIVGIIKPKENTSSPCIKSTIAYSPKLVEKCNYLITQSDVYKEQTKSENRDYSVLNGRPLADSFLSKKELIESYLLTVSEEERNKYQEEFKPYAMNFFRSNFLNVFNLIDELDANLTIKLYKNDKFNEVSRQEFLNFFDLSYQDFMTKFIDNREYDQIEFFAENSKEVLYHQIINPVELISEYNDKGYIEYYSQIMGDYYLTYQEVLNKLGYNDSETPFRIYIYAKDFKGKDKVVSIIKNYNQLNPSKTINYTDYMGLLMSSITTIVNSITYILIGLVSISLIVSSIMIGIITYTSVLERTKEIGVLRSLGASKKDIFTLFNAETITLGFCSGSMGVLFTALINIPLNMILNTITGIGTFVSLNYITAIMLILISILLSFISGLIPSQVASKKDPVIALRSE